jgi:hypothetical protein
MFFFQQKQIVGKEATNFVSKHYQNFTPYKWRALRQGFEVDLPLLRHKSMRNNKE